ncbi:short-chain collagen C4-like [Argopecten irradians]|uniref:short-chain collagen C4-like n=1 Tax=Argopecten irradians TaxID=31199 RepID=UPI003720490A
MSLIIMFSVLVTLTLSVTVTCDDVRDKRILLSDPDYVQQELHQIQVKLQEYDALKTEVTSLQSEVSSLQSDVSFLQSKVIAQDSTINELLAKTSLLESSAEKRGVVYVRWGRKDCKGNGTELVYSGFAGGSYYGHTGAAAEYVCLPPEPMWGPRKHNPSYPTALMYGSEYEDPVLFGMPNHNEEVPCAVCRSSSFSTSIMIPARTTCYPGWEEAYTGNLASGSNDHAASSEYVCVDEHPQALMGGGTTDDNGKLFYQVRTRCGSLKCPPYENDRVISCVVCLK